MPSLPACVRRLDFKLFLRHVESCFNLNLQFHGRWKNSRVGRRQCNTPVVQQATLRNESGGAYPKKARRGKPRLAGIPVTEVIISARLVSSRPVLLSFSSRIAMAHSINITRRPSTKTQPLNCLLHHPRDLPTPRASCWVNPRWDHLHILARST